MFTLAYIILMWLVIGINVTVIFVYLATRERIPTDKIRKSTMIITTIFWPVTVFYFLLVVGFILLGPRDPNG